MSFPYASQCFTSLICSHRQAPICGVDIVHQLGELARLIGFSRNTTINCTIHTVVIAVSAEVWPILHHNHNLCLRPGTLAKVTN